MKAHTTHTTKRFNRHNLGPGTAAALGVLGVDEDTGAFAIRAIVSAAARFTSEKGDEVKFDQLFMAHPDRQAAELVSVPVAEDHRTSVFFHDTPVTQRIKDLDGGCWFQMVISKRASSQLRPMITWQPLDERSWLPTMNAATKFPIPALGLSWPFAVDFSNATERNPRPWQLLKAAAVALGGMPSEAFPGIGSDMPQDLTYMIEREAAVRADREVTRMKRILEKLPDDMRDAYLAKLAKAATE